MSLRQFTSLIQNKYVMDCNSTDLEMLPLASLILLPDILRDFRFSRTLVRNGRLPGLCVVLSRKNRPAFQRSVDFCQKTGRRVSEHFHLYLIFDLLII
jgi:hypothetical protein